ncbi:MAG: transcriptional regulator [Candidatus Omnitrophota bacterium]|nr:MAG: transcriptional regulator [Candidatus Omnitrophota bacterium]
MGSKKRIYKMIGKRIREERKRKGLTQEDLAFKAGVSVNFIGQIERATKKPSIDTLEKISSALGIELKNLFEDVEYSPPEEDLMTKKIINLLRGRSISEKKIIYQIARFIIKKK